MVAQRTASVDITLLFRRLLHQALRRFLPRAGAEPGTPRSEASDVLRIELDEPGLSLTVAWLGTCEVWRVPRERPFSEHELRMVRAIGAVLEARYRAVFNPQMLADHADLFQGDIEDRYVGAFLSGGEYRLGEHRADRIAAAIDVLRVAALSSYENRPISTGVLLLDDDEDPCGQRRRVPPDAVEYSQAITGVKTFFRLCDGLRTVVLVNRQGRLIDIVDIGRWSLQVGSPAPLAVPCATTFRPHALATRGNGHVCAVLSPTHEIKVFAAGTQVFAFRGAGWHLLDLEAKYRAWARAVGNEPVAERLFQVALDLSDARIGALFVVLRHPLRAMAELLDPADIIMDNPARQADAGLTRRDFSYLLSSRNVVSLDPSVLAGFAGIDGATVCDREGRLIAVGAILRHPQGPVHGSRPVTEGARSTAALAASRFGPVLKVSEDGGIACFDRTKLWDI